MRGKSSKQIKMRAKNRKDPSRKNEPIESNAIKYYFEHSVAPRIAMTELKSYDPRYGNTGFGVFKGRIQNWKGFWLKVNCSQMKLLNFENWSNVDLSKIEHHFRK